MRCVIYIRVSTSEQCEFGVSLPDQRKKLLDYAALYGYEVVEVIEEDQSAKNLKRPELQRALAMLRSGAAESLLVVKLDRLTRNLGDWQHLIDNYFSERKGKTLISMGESIDTTTAVGRMMLNMIVLVAAWERETIGERTRGALRYKKSQGQRVGTIPFGFNLAADGVMLFENAAEQRVLAIIRGLRADGWSYRKIAAELDRRNLPTKRGGAWTPGVVRKCVMREGAAV